MTARREGRTRRAPVTAFRDGRPEHLADRLAVEEPLAIRLSAGGETRTVAVTLRTPGDDLELAAGFLFAEGVLGERDEVRRIVACPREEEGGAGTVRVELAAGRLPDLASLERHFPGTSACGLCGRASLEALRPRERTAPPGPLLAPALIASLPGKLEAAQAVFRATGGLHAAALFDGRGDLVAAREDIGRHNAMDKLHRLGVPRGAAAARRPHRPRERPRELGARLEGARGVGARLLRRLRPEQPGGRPGGRGRHDPGGVPPARPVQRLRRRGADRSGRPGLRPARHRDPPSPAGDRRERLPAARSAAGSRPGVSGEPARRGRRYAATVPCGSITNFRAAPLSKSL